MNMTPVYASVEKGIFIDIQSNHINKDTEAAIESIHIEGVCILSWLNVEKQVRVRDKEICL